MVQPVTPRRPATSGQRRLKKAQGAKRCGPPLRAPRRVALGPMTIVERLEACDDAGRSLSYSIVEGPMPAENYLATICVAETGANSCHVDWSASFDLPEGVTEAQIAPALEEIASDLDGRLTVAKVNIDENPATPSKYGVRGIPTLILFKDGQVAATKVGTLPKNKLLEWVESQI